MTSTLTLRRAPSGKKPAPRRPPERTKAVSLPEDSLANDYLQAIPLMTAVLAGESLASGLLRRVTPARRPAVQDMVYGTLRAYGRGDFLLGRLLQHPLDDPAARALLLLAINRLETDPERCHTVVDQAVTAAGQIDSGRFRGLINAVLRRLLREEKALLGAISGHDEGRWQHPGWWLEKLRADHPDDWQRIATAGNQPPPMALRVNCRRSSVSEALAALAAAGIEGEARGAAGILLSRPQPVERLPGFAEGKLSVQDLGAQHAAFLLDPLPGARVLDACAAPGGKTAHLLERAEVELLALDLDPTRCQRIGENLERLGLLATVVAADATRPASWNVAKEWRGQVFDLILADVPCTASGVVRRHPDAKWLRRADDIARFAANQARLLRALWPLVKPGGKLLYATCSVFDEENGQQMAQFVQRTPDARIVGEENWLPHAEHDGFYYCLLSRAI